MRPRLVVQTTVMRPLHACGPLKELDRSLAQFLETERYACGFQFYEELLCCCERGRHAIKDFTTQGHDGKVSDCFPVAGDALRDLQWCLDGFGLAIWASESGLGSVLAPIVQELGKTSIKKQSPSVYCSDARNGHGSARLPPSLDVDFIGEIEYSRNSLGEGSQGKVYKAVWGRRSAHLPPTLINVDDLDGTEDLSELGYEAWSQLVAVKEVSSGTQSEGLEAMEALFSRNSGRDSGRRNNLDRELDVLKTLNHPNIVELKGYTSKVREGKYGLVMELMKGSLKGLMESGKLQKFSDLQKVDLLLQVARGMHFLHRVGIMHRDLKPANILIRELNHLPLRLGYVVAKLADFGLSKGVSKQEDLAAADGAGWHSNMQGTKFYMAPELLKSSNGRECVSWYAISADVFSFGSTCFNVLTGEETPYTQEGHPLTSEEFYRMIEGGHPFNIKCGRSKMARLVRQCWCLDPRKRPDFVKICQILEDEKREMLCQMKEMEIKEGGYLEIAKAARRGLTRVVFSG